MILKTRDGADVKLQAAEWGTESLIPIPGSSILSSAGVAVTTDLAYGLPAISNVLRSPSELIASMPFISYSDRETREWATDSWQWSLLHDKPHPEGDPFQFWFDLVMSVEATQNAFVQKVVSGGEVFQAEVIDPQRVKAYRNANGDKRFDIWNSPTRTTKGLTTDDILHIRGFCPSPGGVCGVSLLEMHRNPIGAAVAMQRFEGDFFRNNAVPPFFFTGAANQTQAREILDFHNQRHAGSGNQWRVGALWGSTGVTPVPISMKDAMFIEAKNMSIEDVCRIWRWPRRLLEIGEAREAAVDLNQADSELLKLYVLPRLKRIESAFNADPDFYYQTPLFGEFLAEALERGDVHTRYDAYRLARQGGWVTANELRKKENLPPHPDGDSIQITPVGGAPNATSPPVGGGANGHVNPREAEFAISGLGGEE